MQDFKKLIAWQHAHRLTLQLHVIAGRFPSRGFPGLKSQLLRAAASVPANIAEGAGRETAREFAQFLQIALGSVVELENHLRLAYDLGYVPRTVYLDLEAQVTGTRRLLIALQRSVRARAARPRTDVM